jgi:hypothetical protein
MSMSNNAVNIEDLELSADDLAGIERRIHFRKAVSIRAKISVPGQEVLVGHTVDLSRRGASITMPFALAAGQNCLIDLELEACGMTGAFQIPAQVRYCVPFGAEQFRTGVQFGQTDDATTALIAAVLK